MVDAILVYMRLGGLSLVGLLVVIGIIALLARFYTIPVVQRGQGMRQQAQQFAGQNASGIRHTESISFTPAGSGRRFQGLLVDSVVVGGPMNEHFGLLPGDIVTGIVGMPELGFLAGDDPETAAALVLEAYQRSQSLIVNRPEIGTIQLPRDAAQVSAQQQAALTPTTAPAGTASPATPPAPPVQRHQTLMDRIQQNSTDDQP